MRGFLITLVRLAEGDLKLGNITGNVVIGRIMNDRECHDRECQTRAHTMQIPHPKTPPSASDSSRYQCQEGTQVE